MTMHVQKNQGQRLVRSKHRVKTNGRTDTIENITFPANAVGSVISLISNTASLVS